MKHDSTKKKKILVVTPRFPYPENGACEQDRAESIRQLKSLGYSVRVIGKVFDWQDKIAIKEYWGSQNIPVSLVEYKYHKLDKIGKLKRLLFGLFHPKYLDGAAFEYTDTEIQSLLEKEMAENKPDLVWFDYTYLWPLYKLVKSVDIPIVTRSINVEAKHFLDEDGKTLINYLKSIPKFWTEKTIANRSDLVFSINKNEEKYYKEIGAKVINLPLRALYKKIDTHRPIEKKNLHVFFSGSTYNVDHNRKALEFIIQDVAPEMENRHPGKFTFHITGAKLPEGLDKYFSDKVIYEGFVEDMGTFLKDMDIALVPSFFGAGMQQKIFEPLTRGFPTITHQRGLGGYNFELDKEVLVANDLDSFCSALESLQSIDRRKQLSQNAKSKSKSMFSKEILDRIVKNGLDSIANQKLKFIN